MVPARWWNSIAGGGVQGPHIPRWRAGAEEAEAAAGAGWETKLTKQVAHIGLVVHKTTERWE